MKENCDFRDHSDTFMSLLRLTPPPPLPSFQPTAAGFDISRRLGMAGEGMKMQLLLVVIGMWRMGR